MSRIYFLSDDPEEAVQWLTDSDVIRMPIEISQVLLAVWSTFPEAERKGVVQTVVPALDNLWTPWAGETQDNYVHLWNYGMDVIDEHEYRFGRHAVQQYRHGMDRSMNRLQAIPPIPEGALTPYPLSVTEAVLMQVDITKVQYSHREKPTWKK
jgi:hypothetical protein